MSVAAFNREDILRTFRLFHEPGSVVELRALPRNGGPVSGFFDDAERFTDAVMGLADRDFKGIYFTINPVNPELFQRSPNAVRRRGDLTKDRDILRRCWLPIDFDPVRPADSSSTDEEHDAASQMAAIVRARLIERGWPEKSMILADSGNGAHLCVRINLPNDSESTRIVKGCLAALDREFSNAKVKIDTTTSNASRIWKVYGTVAKKGDNTDERPHRTAKIWRIHDNR